VGSLLQPRRDGLAGQDEEVVALTVTSIFGERNRLLEARERIALRLDDMPETARRKVREKASLSTDELFVYQGWKSRAQLEGLLTLDEAMTVYTWLGEDEARDELGWPTDTDLAARVATTTLMLELGSHFVGVAVRP